MLFILLSLVMVETLIKIFSFNMNTMLKVYVLINECKIQTIYGQNITGNRPLQV